MESEVDNSTTDLSTPNDFNNDENSVMRSIAKRMTEAQIEAVSEYLQGLQPR